MPKKKKKAKKNKVKKIKSVSFKKEKVNYDKVRHVTSVDQSDRRNRIRKRIKKIISGTAKKPRLSVFRSNKEIYAQLIDDQLGNTLISASSRDKEINSSGSEGKIPVALEVGKLLATKAKKAGIENIKFDRGGYLYHGRVKALADGAREAGLKF